MIRRPPRSTRTDTLFPLHDALPISATSSSATASKRSPAPSDGRVTGPAATSQRESPALASGAFVWLPRSALCNGGGILQQQQGELRGTILAALELRLHELGVVDRVALRRCRGRDRHRNLGNEDAGLEVRPVRRLHQPLGSGPDDRGANLA